MADLHLVTAPAPLDLQDFFRRGRWRHVLWLTYSFDLPFFESYLLPLLVQGGARAITVAMDAGALARRLPAWLDAGEVREAGRTYALHGVHVPGAFHPKLLLAASEEHGAVLVGSGNISAYGMASGGELFTLAEWVGGQVPDLARAAWQACHDLTAALPVDPLCAEAVTALGQVVPALAGPVAGSALLHNLTEPLLPQFLRRLPARPVADVLLWSPFADRRLDALGALVERLAPRRVTLALQPGITSIDGERLSALGTRYPQVGWEFVELRHRADPRQLVHAKGLLVRFESGADWLLGGSANLSAPALLETAAQANLEIGLVLSGPDLRAHLFAPDGPIVLGSAVDPRSVVWAGSADSAPPTAEPTALLIGAHWDGVQLILQIQGDCPLPAQVVLADGQVFPVSVSGEQWRVTLPADAPLLSVLLTWAGGQSGPLLISHLPRLLAARRERETVRHTPLATIDYGGDGDLLAVLDELAALAIASTQDVARLLHGRGGPSAQEEAQEAAGSDEPLIDLSAIDFTTVTQHPRGRAYAPGAGNALDAPRLQLWLDEVVQQFDQLRERQYLRLVAPEADEETPDDDGAGPPDPPPRRWPVSRRLRVLVGNRMRRYVAGIGDPRFWRLITPPWMATNYTLFLSLLQRFWERTADPQTLILPVDDLTALAADLLAAFWGDADRRGYWATLNADEQVGVGLQLLERHSDALTLAIGMRLLDGPTAKQPHVPYTIAGVVRAVEEAGLLTVEAAERALLYLDQAEQDPQRLLGRLQATRQYFSWDWHLGRWAQHYQLSRVVQSDVGYGDGLALRVDDPLPITAHDRPLAVFADWIALVTRQQPQRRVFQLLWGPPGATLAERDLLVYDADSGTLIHAGVARGGHRPRVTLTRGSSVAELAGWQGLEPPQADHVQAG